MNGFYIIFQASILLILAITPILIMFLGENFSSMENSLKYFLLIVLLFIEFGIITLLIQKFFYGPIEKLEIAIKNFYVGNLKNKDINFDKTLNSNLNFILSFFGKTLNTLKNIKDEFIHGKEIKSEVELGKEIQGKMLSKKLTKIPSLDVIIKSKPAGEIGGDSYDIMQKDDNFYIYVGDATGHGVGAGFIMIMVNALMSGFTSIYKNGAQILSKTNEVLKPRIKANLLMSMLLVRWDEKNKKMFMTGAGHEYLMIYKHSKKKTFRIKSGGVALGMIKNISKLVKEQGISFEENDIIVLYSDGITEAINKSKRDGSEQIFGEDRLEDVINNSPNINNKDYKSARSVFNNITIELSKFMGYKHLQLDDITLGVVHYKPEVFDITNDFPSNIDEDFITEWNW